MYIWMSMLAPGRNRAQFLTADRNTHVLGRTPSYNLSSRRATADPLYVVSTPTGLQKSENSLGSRNRVLWPVLLWS
jgi:hypothetical protein